MNMRQTLILAASVLLGCLIVGSFLGRPAAAEPKAEVPAAGRYQVVGIHSGNAAAGSVVVMDTTTGECWSNNTSGEANQWHAIGSPKAK